MKTEKVNISEVRPENIDEVGLFCIKDKDNPGFSTKKSWYERQYRDGLRMHILKDVLNQSLGFIEYVPAEYAWRPIEARGFMFIHCIMIYPRKFKQKGYGSLLLKNCEDEARKQNMHGVCVMVSKGPWIADNRLFENHGFRPVDERERFVLLSKKWNNQASNPALLDWTEERKQYKGWHLVYADQCPWHEKAVHALQETAEDNGINLQIKKLNTVGQAKKAPSGYGVFSLIRDGRLLEDHYISATRFRNILKEELD